MTIQELAKQKILILDGAMGTMIQEYGLSEDDFRNDSIAHIEGQIKGNNDVLNITRPDIIFDIHRRYLEAGADLIETNTFSSQRISQADYHLEDLSFEMAFEGARIARQAADKYSTPDKPRFVLGSVGPTNKTCSMSPDVSDPSARDLDYDCLYAAYYEQIEALIKGGVDAILIETIFDTLNAKVAIDAGLHVMEDLSKQVIIMLSVTISDLAGRTLSGQTLDAFLASISSYPIFSVGLNCSFGASQMKPYLKELASKAPYYISAYPNAGLPNSMGEYDETAESMSPQVAEFIEEGLVNIIGGCCGTTDEFIKSFASLAEGRKPHVLVPRDENIELSGLDVIKPTLFVNVGERCNVAGSRKFLRLIKEKKYEEAMSIARKQVEDGAMVIDINMDDGLLDSKKEMVKFLNLIGSDPDIATVPVMIDSSNWDVIIAGLKCMQGKCIVNSISLKEGEEAFISHAKDVRRFGAAVVVMCFDETGQATTYERRIEIAARAYHLLIQKAGFMPQDIIIDPNILAIATGMEEHDRYALDFIRATKWIHDNLPGAHVSGGVSNLSFSFRGNNYIREAMHSVFLYHAIQAGMDFGIVNPSTKIQYSDIPEEQLTIIEDAILYRHEGASEALIELANELNAQKQSVEQNAANLLDNNAQQAVPAWRSETVEQRLSYALRKGIGDYLEEDLHEALKIYAKPVEIIEGPFARTMKQAVTILQPYIEQMNGSENSKKRGKIVLATVKGDVHDIGKNIVSVVMACNNYEIIDLGVMVPAEQIVSTAIREKADAVGLSGLITPSLEEMVNVAIEMQKAGLDIPIMIGGATTSKMHVAIKIAPVYQGPVVWMKDASQNITAANTLLNADSCSEYKQQLNQQYKELRELYQQEQTEHVPLDEARKNKLELFD